VRAYLLSIVIWSALSLLTGWNYLIFDQSVNIHSTLTQMIFLAEARGLAFALLTPPIFYIVRRYSSGVQKHVRYLLAYCLGAGPFMVVYACIRWVILPPWSPSQLQFVSRGSAGPWAIVHDGFADIITNYVLIVVAAHAYGYLERMRKQELERSEFEHALAASELQALKMQLHPHFLFNTLHGISTLIDSDGAAAKAMIVKLSSLLRMALEHSGSDLIPLQEEMKFIGEYLDLEKMRFGARLAVMRLIDPATLPMLVPQLILQPLVENAIRHGIAGSRENGWVEIESRRTAQGLELLVRNSVGDEKPRGSGLGLRNTEARLRHLYADEARFAFEMRSDRTATAALFVPALGSHAQPSELLDESIIGNEAAHHAGIDHR
jgi:two-component system LytT family sensor kinase